MLNDKLIETLNHKKSHLTIQQMRLAFASVRPCAQIRNRHEGLLGSVADVITVEYTTQDAGVCAAEELNNLHENCFLLYNEKRAQGVCRSLGQGCLNESAMSNKQWKL